jgi:altronate dehydratase
VLVTEAFVTAGSHFGPKWASSFGMPSALELSAVGRLPSPADNAAIAIRRIEAGTVISIGGVPRTLRHTVLEGHRFAVRPIAKGSALLSWGLPFGVALGDIEPGDVICNPLTLEILSQRDLGGAVLPPNANFESKASTFVFSEASFRPGRQVDPAPDAAGRKFDGYRRPGGRGFGTRNMIVILGTTSRTASFARQLSVRLAPLSKAHPKFDGIVPVAHTEGGGNEPPNNQAELLRTLAGFMVHPNVGAVLAVDCGDEAVNNSVLRDFMRGADYPLDSLTHRFFTLKGGLDQSLAEAEAIVRAWIPAVSSQRREPVPLSGIRMGLQCGGSDGFSGVSANPLVGAVGRQLIRYGGGVNLAETDELVGAESYILANVKDASTVRHFLEIQARFKERLGWHGATVEGNPSGGNRLRGLYNIFLKSLGAAMKKDPALRIDHVIEYAERMRLPGFYFMDSPGNDLESVAGQVAAGCTVICFTTGNGSITNFPFVPTIKVTSTTRRHELLINEMDVNAGAYLDGTPMDDLCAQTFDLLQEVASGRRTKGENAGHYQVSIWRNWQQSDSSKLESLRSRPAPDGKPLALARSAPPLDRTFPAFRSADGRWACDRVGLVVAASLCSSQIALLAAGRLNASGIGHAHGLSRFAALAHTEGCGFAGESVYARLRRTYGAYGVHPSVAAALYLEHGCEKIPNDVIRRHLADSGANPARFGWASVQLDGGIEKVLAKIEAWFSERLAELPPASREHAGLDKLSVGFLTDRAPAPPTAAALGELAQWIVGAGGGILLPEGSRLLHAPEFLSRTIGAAAPRPTLAYGQPITQPGFHIVETETDHRIENLSGLGGCGAQTFLAIVDRSAQPGHPFIPIVQFAEADLSGAIPADEIDGFLSGDAEQDSAAILDSLLAAAAGSRVPAAIARGNTDFQITRGLLGVST